MEIGFTPSTTNHSLFMLGEGEQRSFMVVYMDDILIFSPSSDLVKEVMLKLQDKFKCKALVDVNFYLGLHIERDVEKRCMRVHQREYLEALAAKFGQSEGHMATPFLSGFNCVKEIEEESIGEEERRRFHSLVCSLMYTAVNTRPDVAFATRQLAMVVQCPNEEAQMVLKSGVCSSQPSPMPLMHQNRRTWEVWFICCVGGGPTAWESKKQDDQALSTVESEYMALFRAVREIVWLQCLLDELGEEEQGPTPLYCDNQGAIALAKNHVLHGLTKHMRFDTWLDDLQLYLLSDSRDSVLLFDHTSSAAPAPPATADTATRSQWLTRDAAARLVICNHLPLAECAHFGQHRTAQALYDAVVARYSSPATAALGRLLLPYLFPELSAFATVEDLISNLRTSDARYRAALPAEFLAKNPPPMYITLYFIVTRLPDSLRAIRDHFLALEPTALTVDLLEQHLLAAETSVVDVVDIHGAEDVGAASASGKRRSSKGKGGRGGGRGSGGGGGAAVEVVEAVEVVAVVGVVAGVGALMAVEVAVVGVEVVAAVGVVVTGLEPLSEEALMVARGSSSSSSSSSSVRARPCRPNSFFGDEAERPRWAELLRTGVAFFDLLFDAILAAMYALSASAKGECYLCVPLDLGIEAATLGATESVLPGTAPAEALHTFTLDSGASRCFFHNSTTLTPHPAPVPVRLADPSEGPNLAHYSTVLPCPARVPICTYTRTGRHLATFIRRPGSSLYTLATKPPRVAASAKVSTSGQVAPPCSCRLLSHQTLLWHHRLGHPSLPRLRGMHSRLLVSSLPRSLPPLPPSPAPPCLPCVEGRQHAAPHFSLPPTTAPLQTLHMDVWGPARVSGQGRELYFMLVVDDFTRYNTVFPLRSKGQVVDVLIPWICAVCLQLRKRFRVDLPILHLHSDRGGEFSSDLLQEFCRGEGILQLFTLPDSPQQNGIAERRIGLVMEVARTYMIHAAAPHLLWPFAVRYAAHQLNLWPHVSLPETLPILRWTGKVGNASVFR
ncbi:unnamed protein product, partial [Closterium sp. NIES-54]